MIAQLICRARFVRGVVAVVGATLIPCGDVHAQPQAPKYEECRLDSIYPAGGRAGTAVEVEFRGVQGGLQNPRTIVIDGPRGIGVKELKSVAPNVVRATLDIAADAPPGRRWLRVATERSGLTNFAAFQVGRLPERLEKEPNNERAAAERIETPLVVNGAITPKADADWYSFAARRGQRIVVAIAAHSLDIHGQGGTFGIADFNLELVDAQGRTLASAEDSLGLDPLIEWQAPDDGDYFVRVGLLNHSGFPEAVYRLTIGEVPYVTGVFPPGVQRGQSVEVELLGPNIAPGVRRRIAPPADGAFPMIHVGEVVNYGVANDDDLSQRNSLGNGQGVQPLGGAAATNSVTPANASLAKITIVGDVSAAIGDWPERVEREAIGADVQSPAEPTGAGTTNDSRDTAEPVDWPATVNGRFQRAGDEDWFRVTLAEKQRVWIETIAHRFVRSPVDTSLQVFDSQGALVAENDDDATIDPGYESIHDFKTTDSRILLTAPKSGDYWIRVGEQSGNHGPRAVYRLSVYEAVPDFQLRHFPDAVPIWGPGSTAAVLVKIDRLAGCNDEIELTVEGLDPKWRSSKTMSLGTTPERPLNQYQSKMFLTITAPDDAPLGSTAEFRIVGRMKRDGKTIERRSWPITLFYTSDTGFFRASPAARAAVAKAQGPWLEAITTEITTTPGGKTTIPVRVRGAEGLKEMPLVVNLIAAGVGCGITTPQTLPIVDGRVEVPLTLPPEVPPGEFGIVVAQTWRSDIRVGMPGPCTPLIKLRVAK